MLKLQAEIRQDIFTLQSRQEYLKLRNGTDVRGVAVDGVENCMAALKDIESGKIHLVPQLVYMSGCKYLGYLAGKRYQKLPRFVILRCTMNKNYWKG